MAIINNPYQNLANSSSFPGMSNWTNFGNQSFGGSPQFGTSRLTDAPRLNTAPQFPGYGGLPNYNQPYRPPQFQSPYQSQSPSYPGGRNSMFPFGANTPQEYNAYRAWSQQQQFPEYSDYMGGPTHPNPAFGDVGIATPYRGNSMGNVSIDPSLIDKLRKMGLISPYQQQNLGALDRFGSNSTTQDQWTRISAATGIPVNQVQSALWQAQGISNQYDPTFTSTKFQWDPLRNQLVQVPGTGPHTNTYSSSQGYYGGRPPSNPAGYAMSQGGGGYGGGYDQSYGYGGLPNYGGGGANFGGGAMPMSRTLGGINPTGAVPFPTPVTPAPVTPAPGIARGSITERLPYAPPGGRGFGQPATPLEIAAGAAPGARTRRGIGERVPRNLIGGRMFAG